MLVITRKKEEKIIIGNEVVVQILDIGRNRVRLGIQAPKHITIPTGIKTTEGVLEWLSRSQGQPTTSNQ